MIFLIPLSRLGLAPDGRANETAYVDEWLRIGKRLDEHRQYNQKGRYGKKNTHDVAPLN
jgi:hypothetical protein